MRGTDSAAGNIVGIVIAWLPGLGLDCFQVLAVCCAGLCLSADGTLLVSISRDKSVKVSSLVIVDSLHLCSEALLSMPASLLAAGGEPLCPHCRCLTC